MKNRSNVHTFHIPVMGIAFTIDAPIRVAQYGISSVVSLVDDTLIEHMREVYSGKFNISFQPITDKIDDFRAKRITAYLNLMDKIVRDKFEELKSSILKKDSELKKYIEMLPDFSVLKKEFYRIVKDNDYVKKVRNWVQDNLSVGSIDVNIMTKIDSENYNKKETLPIEYNDAHAALRGFAMSNLESSIILSAGMNPRLYGYIENFEDFYPDENGHIKKKIVIKVSDYRSAFIQGKFFAKKGLWVSEYRIESGLNCGGHAFATDGYLLGPVLEEFRDKRNTLIQEIHEMLTQALKNKNRSCPMKPPELKITAQGGVGTAKEHQFLLDYYQLDSIGWGTPFLLVPEITNLDNYTRNLLSKAGEEDLYLSKISPMGIPFNSIKNNTKDIEKLEFIKKGRPGSSCPKKFLVSNTEFTDKPICTASRQYQHLKIKELDAKSLNNEEYKERFDKITNKSCLCVGLTTSALLVNNLDTKKQDGVSVCPGPNMAYFSEVVSFKEMVDHIYGRIDIIKSKYRPHMFIKELTLYIDYLKDKIDEVELPVIDRQMKYLIAFQENLNEGIKYYKNLFFNFKSKLNGIKVEALEELEILEKKLKDLNLMKLQVEHA